MSVKKSLSDNAPTILSAAAGIGVGVTGFLGVTLGMQIESDKENLKSDDQNAKKKAWWRVAKKAILSGIALAATEFCIFKSNGISKERIAGAATAAGVFAKMLKDYRSNVPEEQDKEIMQKMQMDGVEEDIKEKDLKLDPGQHYWTDEYIKYLSDGKISYYRATEADIAFAALFSVNTYCNGGYVTLGVFYDALRKRGVTDLPERMIGENDITWEATCERFDFFGRNGLDFDYAKDYLEDGKIEVCHIFFDADDEEINKANEELLHWADGLDSRK